MDEALAPRSQMELFYDSSRLLLDNLYQRYGTNSKLLISKISQDKGLSQFDTFYKRLKISWGMKIDFTDGLANPSDAGELGRWAVFTRIVAYAILCIDMA